MTVASRHQGFFMRASSIDPILDPHNKDNVFLIDDNLGLIEFEQIALIPMDDELYAILKPVGDFEGLNDEAPAFLIWANDDDEAILDEVHDEEIKGKIFAIYNKLFDEAQLEKTNQQKSNNTKSTKNTNRQYA